MSNTYGQSPQISKDTIISMVTFALIGLQMVLVCMYICRYVLKNDGRLNYDRLFFYLESLRGPQACRLPFYEKIKHKITLCPTM